MLYWIFKTLLRKMFYKPMSIEELRRKQERPVQMMGKLPKEITLEKAGIPASVAHSLIEARRLEAESRLEFPVTRESNHSAGSSQSQNCSASSYTPSASSTRLKAHVGGCSRSKWW